jgi:hypothetical protein
MQHLLTELRLETVEPLHRPETQGLANEGACSTELEAPLFSTLGGQGGQKQAGKGQAREARVDVLLGSGISSALELAQEFVSGSSNRRLH